MKKKMILEMIIIFSALILISANWLHNIMTHGWTISFKSQQISKVTLTDSVFKFSFKFQVISCTGSNMHDPLKHIIKTNRVYIFYKLNEIDMFSR